MIETEEMVTKDVCVLKRQFLIFFSPSKFTCISHTKSLMVVLGRTTDEQLHGICKCTSDMSGLQGQYFCTGHHLLMALCPPSMAAIHFFSLLERTINRLIMNTPMQAVTSRQVREGEQMNMRAFAHGRVNGDKPIKGGKEVCGRKSG